MKINSDISCDGILPTGKNHSLPYSQMAMGKLMAKYRRKCVRITDKRIRMMNEILTCVKLIKMYAWEKSFAKAIGW